MHHYRRLIAVVVFLVLLVVIFELSGIRGQFSLEFIQQTIQKHKFWGLVVFALLFSLGNLIQIPGWLFLAAAVLSLGKTTGGMVTYFAASVSCVITFLAVRYVGQDALLQLNHRLALRIMHKLHAQPIRSVALLRTLFQTMPAVNYTLALSGVSFRHYLTGTLLGLPLPILLYCLFFDSLAKLFVF